MGGLARQTTIFACNKGYSCPLVIVGFKICGVGFAFCNRLGEFRSPVFELVTAIGRRGRNRDFAPCSVFQYRIGGLARQTTILARNKGYSIRRLLHGRRFIKQGFCFAACFILIDETCLLVAGRLVGGIVLRVGFPCGVGIRLDGDRDDQLCAGVSAVCAFGNSIGLIVKSSNFDRFAISNGNTNVAGRSCIFPTVAVVCDIGHHDRNAGVFCSLRSLQFKVAGQGIAQYRIFANVQLKAGNLLADALENFI